MHDALTVAAFSAAMFKDMNKVMDIISDNVISVLHLINSTCLKIKYYNDTRLFEDAISTGRGILDKIGESIDDL